jgi:hypothetical protein
MRSRASYALVWVDMGRESFLAVRHRHVQHRVSASSKALEMVQRALNGEELHGRLHHWGRLKRVHTWSVTVIAIVLPEVTTAGNDSHNRLCSSVRHSAHVILRPRRARSNHDTQTKSVRHITVDLSMGTLTNRQPRDAALRGPQQRHAHALHRAASMASSSPAGILTCPRGVS